MTPQAIAARTSFPLDLIQRGIKFLEAPDPYSRTPGDGGSRILLLDEHRPWGWRIVNHGKYMRLRNMEQKREADRDRIAGKRKQNKDVASESQAVANVAHSDSDSDSVKALDATASLDGFEILWKTYPKRAGNNPKRKAESAYKARLLEKHTPVAMLDGASRYAKFVRSTGKEGTEYVLQTATFLSKDAPFLQPWVAPNGQGSWDRTESATLAKGSELGLPARPGESMEEYRGRIRARIAS